MKRIGSILMTLILLLCAVAAALPAPALAEDYFITFVVIWNGSVEAYDDNGYQLFDDTPVTAGTVVSLCVPPSAPYALNSLTVKDAGNNDVTLTGSRFIMPASNVTVTATFITEWSALQQAINNAADNATIKVSDYAGDDKEIKAASSESALSIPSGKTVTLDLDGCTINRGLTSATSYGYVIRVDGVLTLKDTSTGKTGTVTGGNTITFGGGVYVKSTGTFNMEGGTITGNISEHGGGGVFVNYGNPAPTFNLSGGWIVNNFADEGGGVYNLGNLTMSGGTVSNNRANYDGGVSTSVAFTLSGGKIIDNSAENSCGGVFSSGTFNLSGNPTIHNNTIGTTTASNVFLDKTNGVQSVIIIDGTLSYDTPIGVTMETPGVFTSGLKNNGTAA